MTLEGFDEVSQVLRSGVYALALRGEVVYIGKSKCMLTRIYAHRNINKRNSDVPSWLPIKGIPFDTIFIRPCPVHSLDLLESEMINIYKPKYNIRLKAPGKVTTPVPLIVNNIPLMLNAYRPPAPILERRI